MPIGTLPTGWTQYKITLNFTTDTYTFSTRPNAADAWVPMKAAAAPDYNIPMRGSGDVVSQTTITFRAGGGDRRLGRRARPRRRHLRRADALGCRRHLRGRQSTARRCPGASWVRSGTVFQNAEYDDSDIYSAKQGSLYGYLKGPATPTTATADLVTGVPLSADGSEIRFWANMSTHENYRYILGDAGRGSRLGARSGCGPTRRQAFGPDIRAG